MNSVCATNWGNWVYSTDNCTPKFTYSLFFFIKSLYHIVVYTWDRRRVHFAKHVFNACIYYVYQFVSHVFTVTLFLQQLHYTDVRSIRTRTHNDRRPLASVGAWTNCDWVVYSINTIQGSIVNNLRSSSSMDLTDLLYKVGLWF